MTIRDLATGLSHILRSVPWDTSPTSDVRWRLPALGGLWLSGGVLGLLALLFAAERETASLPLTVIGATASSFGLLIVIREGRRAGRPLSPAWASHLLLGAGSGTIGACVGLAGPGSAPIAYATLFVWIGLYAGVFFSPRATVAHVAVAMATFAAVLGSLEQPIATELVLVGGVTATAAGLTSWLALHRSLACIDHLTGALNRRGLDRALELAVAPTRRRTRPLTLIVLDLDDFRRFNEQRGQVAGDQLLHHAAARWRAQLPEDATLARLGADEFVALLPGHGLSSAGALADELRRSVPGGRTCSAGVTSWTPGDTPSMLLSRADAALYEAKRAGRDRTHTLGDDADTAVELWRALDAGEFLLHYQPIHRLADGQLEGFEALVRWEHPVDGMRPPLEFIAAAERSGAIHALGRWVLDEACRYASELHHRAGTATLTMAVNLSTLQLTDPRLLTDVQHALTTSGLPPSALVLELTENALEGRIEEAAAALHGLRELGVCLAIDDFGTGYSSLNRLRELPFDLLKIDRSFTAGADASARDAALLSSIIALAESLGLETVAEGIETDEQLAFLREHGCRHGQGYLLGRPVPDVEQLVSTPPPVPRGGGDGGSW